MSDDQTAALLEKKGSHAEGRTRYKCKLRSDQTTVAIAQFDSRVQQRVTMQSKTPEFLLVKYL